MAERADVVAQSRAAALVGQTIQIVEGKLGHVPLGVQNLVYSTSAESRHEGPLAIVDKALEVIADETDLIISPVVALAVHDAAKRFDETEAGKQFEHLLAGR